jgi:hypothetical protein
VTLAETADLLSIAAALDYRTIGEADVRAWHMTLADIDFTAATAALTAHYRATTRRVMPADIVQRIKPTPGYDNNTERGIF